MVSVFMTMKARFSLVTLFMLLSACSSMAWLNNASPEKSPIDQREYRYLQLDNGLNVLLISDMDAQKAAASLDVFVGSAQNPENREGLAHFLEHMLFLGTDKYPDAGAYQRFISENGGSHNAYTSFEHTNYFFDIKESAFEPTLDRFSRFFIAPAFEAQYVEREKHAVNAEYRSGIKSDERRQLDVLREIVNPAHPFSKFSVGNLQTLSDAKGSVRDEMIKFYNTYYKARNMRLVVLAPRELDRLEEIVRGDFIEVPDADVPKRGYAQPLFTASELGQWIEIVPEKEKNSLSLLFPLPDQLLDYQDQPLNIIGHVLGHEGEHSLFAYLKSKNWIDGLVAGQALSYTGVTVFSLSMDLTTEGQKHKQDIVQAVFAAIEQVQESAIPRWVFDEVKQISELNFAYVDKSGETQAVMNLSNAMHYYQPRDILKAPYMYQQYRPEKMQTLLSQLKPENAIVLDISPKANAEKRSRYYDTPYSRRAFSAEELAAWQNLSLIADIQLPELNIFLPQNTKIVKAAADQQDMPPQKIELDQSTGSQSFELWYKGIDLFQQLPSK